MNFPSVLSDVFKLFAAGIPNDGHWEELLNKVGVDRYAGVSPLVMAHLAFITYCGQQWVGMTEGTVKYISFNVRGDELNHPANVQAIIEAARELYDTTGIMIKIELTEYDMLDDPTAHELLSRLYQAYGVLVAIDDINFPNTGPTAVLGGKTAPGSI